MEDLLIAILPGLFEFALEVLANIPFDWPLSARKTSEPVGDTHGTSANTEVGRLGAQGLRGRGVYDARALRGAF
jgi:hypothetical protein